VSAGRLDLGGASVIVVNYGSSALLEENLAPLARAVDGVTVVVVDNWSTEAERRRVVALGEREGWSTVTPAGNGGFGAGCDVGVERARSLGARRHVLLNPDATMSPDALAALVAAVRDDGDALVAPRIERPDGSTWSAGSDLYLDDGRVRSRRRRLAGVDPARVRPWLTGACLALSDELWRRAGGFDDAYFLYWEDVDLSQRVLAAGGRLRLLDDVVAVHAEGGTQDSGGEGATSAGEAKSATYYRYNIRNRAVYAVRHLDDADLRSWHRQTPRVAWEVLLQGGRRQLLTSPSTLAVGARAALESRRITRAELRRRRA
jgi:GT2 family glycosyltransferase